MPYRSWLSQPLRPQCPLLPQVGPALTPQYPCPSGACPQPRHPSLCFRGWRGTGEKGGDVCLAGGPRRALFVYFHLHTSAAAGPDSSVSERAPEPPLFPVAARPTAHGRRDCGLRGAVSLGEVAASPPYFPPCRKGISRAKALSPLPRAVERMWGDFCLSQGESQATWLGGQEGYGS